MAYTTIDNPELFFQTLIWTGDGSGTKSFTLDGSENMQPDWVWSKPRDSLSSITGNHFLFDSVRGAGAEKELVSNNTGAEGANANQVYGYISSFNSDGFTTTAGSSNNDYFNKNSIKYVAWNWKAGTSFTNDASATGIGSIDSTGSVSTDAGFSICSYTGTGGTETIKHGLSTKPAIILVKKRSGSANWYMYHHKNTSAPATDFLTLNSSAATSDNANNWNDTEPTSSVFSVGASGTTNPSGGTMIAYCFAEKKGYSKFGSYTGNGNADGTFVYTGFKPAWILTKKSSGSGDSWNLLDSIRNPGNPGDKRLTPDTSNAEATTTQYDILSNGFKARATTGAVNTSGATYIFMAFAEAPFVNSKGVPNNSR